jgi:RND family efflux transporter MFP subunit
MQSLFARIGQKEIGTMKHWWIAVIILGLFVTMGFAGYLGYQRAMNVKPTTVDDPPTVPVERGPINLTVTAPGHLVNTNSPTLFMSASGVVAEVLVRGGYAVQEGKPLIVLANPEQLVADLALEIADAQQRVVEAQTELEKAQRQRTAMDYPKWVNSLTGEQARIRYERALREFEKSLIAFNKVKNKDLLHPERIQALDAFVIARQVMNDALTLYNSSTGNFSVAQLMQADAALAVAQATLQQAHSELAGLQASQAGQILIAPFDGVVLEVMVEPGQAVNKGDAAIVLMDPHTLEAWTKVIEEDIPLVKVGQSAELYIDALPDAVVIGTISHIMPQSIPEEDRPLFYVIVQLHEVPDRLLDGMYLDAAILIAEREDVLHLPRSVIRDAADGSPMVLIWENGQEVERPVELGLRGDLYVEILSGLVEGERVIAR